MNESKGIDIRNYNLHGLIDDLRGLADYLNGTSYQEMQSEELTDWRDRLQAVKDFLLAVEMRPRS